MRIGINASFARKENTGIGQTTLNFLRELSDLKMEDSELQDLEFFVYLEEPLPKNLKLPPNFKTKVFLPLWKRDDLMRKAWWEKQLLPREVKKDRCDALISLYQSTTILPQKIKHLMVVHDIIPTLFPEYLNNRRKKFYNDLAECAVRKADKIIAISRRTEKDLIHELGIDPSKITVSYLDVDPLYKKEVSLKKSGEVMKKYGLTPGYLYAGGGLEIRKNIEGLIEAYKYLWERNKNEYFVEELPPLVISGKLMPQLAPLITDVEKLLRQSNLTQQVKLLDFVPQADLPALYANAAVFVYPSFYEGFGLPVLEAMNQGTPVITAKNSSLPEVGRDSVLYCDPADNKDIAMVLKNILVNKHLQRELSRRGKARAQNFSGKEFAEKVLRNVSQLVSHAK